MYPSICYIAFPDPRYFTRWVQLGTLSTRNWPISANHQYWILSQWRRITGGRDLSVERQQLLFVYTDIHPELAQVPRVICSTGRGRLIGSRAWSNPEVTQRININPKFKSSVAHSSVRAGEREGCWTLHGP